MKEEERRTLIMMGLILLFISIALFTISQSGMETVKYPHKNLISQTVASEDSEQFILRMENEGAELYVVLNESELTNNTEVVRP